MANRLATRLSTGERVIDTEVSGKVPLIDTTKDDESVVHNSNWQEIGNKKIRSTHRRTKHFIKNQEGKTIPIFRSYFSIEVLSSNNELTIFQISMGTGLKQTIYKRYNPKQVTLADKLAKTLNINMPKVFTIFNQSAEDVYETIKNDPTMSSLRALKIPEIRKIQSILKRPESKPKSEFINDLSRILNITEDSARQLTDLPTTSSTPSVEDVEIEQKEEISKNEKQELDLSKTNSLIEMHKELIDEIQVTTDEFDKNEMYAQGIQIERKLKNLGVAVDDSIENYHKPVRTGASWVDTKTNNPKFLKTSDTIEREETPKSKFLLTVDDLIEYAKRRGLELSRDEAEKKLELLKQQDPERMPTFAEEKIKELLNLVEQLLR